MTEAAHPSEIARETLRRLAQRRIPPTPDNYRTLYHEIAGTQADESFPEKTLKGILSALPRSTTEQARFARQMEAAVAEKNLEGVKSALAELLNKSAAEPPAWSALLHDLVVQLGARHTGLTPAKKREALDHVLSSSGTPDILFGRLQSLLRSWSQNAASEAALDHAAVETTPPVEASPAAPSGPDRELQELMAQLLEGAVTVLLVDTPELSAEAGALANLIRGAQTHAEIAALTTRLKKFSYRLNFVAEDQAELKGALLHLLQLIIENISELVVDDQWLQGQVSVVKEVAHQPLNLRQLDDVERRLKDLIFKQSNLKKSLNDAKERLKAMLATFVDRLANFTDTTGGYHDKLEACAKKISKANDIAQISDVIEDVMRETRVIQISAQESHRELTEMRHRVDEAEKEIVRLQTELSQASEMVRLDALTGVLNRKGMDESIEREVARARRHGASLCIALLDIDNFKKLNDTYGHKTGDDALVHLARVARETIRPQDTLARYGGEEFVVLLPETGLDEAVSAMVRVQRALTRKFFMHKNEKLLITFSCGVAELGPEEAPHDSLKRADEAMYVAKRSGKNRVIAA